MLGVSFENYVGVSYFCPVVVTFGPCDLWGDSGSGGQKVGGLTHCPHRWRKGLYFAYKWSLLLLTARFLPDVFKCFNEWLGCSWSNPARGLVPGPWSCCGLVKSLICYSTREAFLFVWYLFSQKYNLFNTLMLPICSSSAFRRQSTLHVTLYWIVVSNKSSQKCCIWGKKSEQWVHKSGSTKLYDHQHSFTHWPGLHALKVGQTRPCVCEWVSGFCHVKRTIQIRFPLL